MENGADCCRNFVDMYLVPHVDALHTGDGSVACVYMVLKLYHSEMHFLPRKPLEVAGSAMYNGFLFDSVFLYF